MFIEALATGAALEIKKRNRKTLQYADLGAYLLPAVDEPSMCPMCCLLSRV